MCEIQYWFNCDVPSEPPSPPPSSPSMEICMKSLSRQGRKSALPLFIIAVQFYGGQAGRQAGASCTGTSWGGMPREGPGS